MSSKKGDSRRTRAQKHQNTYAFKNDLHDKHTPLIKLINNLNISEVCEHCKSVIDWKIKYRKYKPLSQPKACNKCGERKVKRAYHVLCRDCALGNRCCAKCLKSADEASIIPPEPAPHEQVKLKAEMDELIKSLPERKRRTFLRYMNRGKKKKQKDAGSDLDDSEDDRSGADGRKKVSATPRTREELLEKIEQLKLAAAKDVAADELDEFSSDDEDYEDYSDDDFSDISTTK